MNLENNGKLFTRKFFGTGPSSHAKKNLPDRGLEKVEKHCFKRHKGVKFSINASLRPMCNKTSSFPA